MALSDDLTNETSRIFRDKWDVREGQTIPDPEDVKLTNDAVHFKKATILYADISGSTKMVDEKYWYFSAEVYRAYLYCAARIIRAEGGEITAYDGDRIMGVFIGASQCSDAARCGLKINYAVENIINTAIKKQYPNTSFELKQVVGIDTSEIHVARTGVRGDNDLVWVGRAPNYAAKLTGLGGTYSTWISKTVFNSLNDKSKYGGDGKLMWEARSWTDMNGMSIYRSNWWWAI